MTEDKNPTGSPENPDTGSQATGAQKTREQEISDKEREVVAFSEGDPEIPPSGEGTMAMGDPEIPPSNG